MKIIFVRHGEPLRNDYGIADMGKQEMRFLAEYLKLPFLKLNYHTLFSIVKIDYKFFQYFYH